MLACRLSHVFGLVAVLGTIAALGWTPLQDTNTDATVVMQVLAGLRHLVEAAASVLPSFDESALTHLSTLLPH